MNTNRGLRHAQEGQRLSSDREEGCPKLPVPGTSSRALGSQQKGDSPQGEPLVSHYLSNLCVLQTTVNKAANSTSRNGQVMS